MKKTLSIITLLSVLFGGSIAQAFSLPVVQPIYYAPADVVATSSIDQPDLCKTCATPEEALKEGIGTVYSFLSDNEVYWSEKAEVGSFKAYDYTFDIIAIDRTNGWITFAYDGWTYTHNWTMPNPQ